MPKVQPLRPVKTDALMLRCCHLFYMEDMGIQEIGHVLGISRFKVSRHLKEARARGIVRVQILDPGIAYEELAVDLERALSLRRVVVTPTPYNGDSDAVRRAIGTAGAEMLSGVDPNTSIGITWGRTIAHMVSGLPSEGLHALRVSELAGGVGKITTQMSAHAIALRAAEKLHAECIQLSAPIIADSKRNRVALLGESSIRMALEVASKSRVAVVGVSPVTVESLLFRSGFLSKDDFAQLTAAGAVGAILGRFFDLSGHECDTEFKDRAVALTFEAFVGIPERIALAGGREKVKGILGLARGGLVTSLVTDSLTAQALLRANVAEMEPARLT